MKFTTGYKEIKGNRFTVRRLEGDTIDHDLNVKQGLPAGWSKKNQKPFYYYHNVEANDIRIGETIYHKNGKYLGYRCE
jgi:hypothetical protein